MQRILIVTDYYLPGYKGGGPVRTISNTVEWLGDEFAFYVLAGDRDFKDSQPYSGVRPGEWTPVGKAQVRYLTPDERRFGALGRVIAGTGYDLLYVNSFFAPMCAKTVLLHGLRRIPRDRPLLLNPRGEFNPGSLGHKGLKKRAYLTLIHALNLAGDIHWQAASEGELANIRREFPGLRRDPARGMVVPNLPRRLDGEPPAPAVREPGQPLRIAFLSRVARTKNLHYALQVLADVRSPVQFDIYGPREDPAYWDECQALMAALPGHVQAAYRGEVTPEAVVETLSAYHLFYLPTRGESYGHVIWEALYAGCLPLISDRTPWTLDGIGWTLPLDEPARFGAAIDAAAQFTPDEQRQRARSAQELARQSARPAAVLDANRAMFRALLGGAAGSTHKDG